MDKLKAIRAFINVAETGGFAKAAAKLNTSAPSVTRLIGELEADLGVSLLRRSTRVVSLTDVGQCYFNDCKKIVSDMSIAEDMARGAHHEPSGVLRVTASTMFGQTYVMPVLTEYLREYEKTSIEAMLVDRVVNIMDEGIDVAIRIGELSDSNMMATKVGEVRFMICGCPSYFEKFGIPQTPEDLLKHQTIGLNLGSFQSDWKFSNGIQVKPKHRINMNSIGGAVQAAKDGFGLVRVLSYQVGPELDSGCIQTVLHDYAPEAMPIHVIHAQGRSASAKVRNFVDLMVNRLRANPFIN